MLPIWIMYWSYSHIKYKIPLGRLKERIGFLSAQLPKNAIWIHAVSIGELKLAKLLIQNLPSNTPIVISTISGHGFEKHIDAPHFYLPIDLIWSIRKTMRFLKPSALVLIETEIWPCLISEATCPVLLMNGRLSDNSFKKYLRFSGFIQPAIAKLAYIGCVSDKIKQRFEKLGGNVSKVHPNFKLLNQAVPIQKPNKNNHKTLVCGCTHPVEDEKIISLLPKILEYDHNFQLVIIPRHQRRANELINKYQGQFEGNLHIESRYGVTLEWYEKAHLVFIGGSLIKHGGQNPLEALSRYCHVIMGPHYENFKLLVEELIDNQLIDIIANAEKIIDYCQQEPKSINPNPYFNSHGLKAQEAVTNLVHILEPFTEQATV